MSHMCKRIFKFELQLSSYWQNIKFSRYCPKFHIFTNIVIFQVYLQFFRPTALSLWILWQGHVRNTLFHFCQLWAVNCAFSLHVNETMTHISFQFISLGDAVTYRANQPGFLKDLSSLIKLNNAWLLWMHH